MVATLSHAEQMPTFWNVMVSESRADNRSRQPSDRACPPARRALNTTTATESGDDATQGRFELCAAVNGRDRGPSRRIRYGPRGPGTSGYRQGVPKHPRLALRLHTMRRGRW